MDYWEQQTFYSVKFTSGSISGLETTNTTNKKKIIFCCFEVKKKKYDVF